LDLLFLKAVALKAIKRRTSKAKNFFYSSHPMICMFLFSCREYENIVYALNAMETEIRSIRQSPDLSDINVHFLRLVYRYFNYKDYGIYVDPLIEQILVPWYQGEDLMLAKLKLDLTPDGCKRTKGALCP
jgi:hypothetical protein